MTTLYPVLVHIKMLTYGEIIDILDLKILPDQQKDIH